MSALRVLVTDGRRSSALAVVRSLGRAGHHVVVADTGPRSTAGRSRYAVAEGTYPSPFTDGVAATAAGIVGLARRHAIDVVVPVTDDVLVPLRSTGIELPEGCTLLAAPDRAVTRAASKIATVELARDLGVAVPDHLVLEDPTDGRGTVARLGTPVVVKPDRSRWVDDGGVLRRGAVRYARTDDEVAALVAAAGQPVLAQRHHPGVGHGIGLVLDQGRALLAVAHRRVHEVPVTGGASAVRETIDPDPGLLADACALLGELKWTGAAMVEHKVDPRGSVLMEVNGRFWGSLPLALRAGCDIPAAALRAHLGEGAPTGLDTDYRRGVRARNLDLELVWIGSLLARGAPPGTSTPGRRQALAAARDLLRRDQGDDLLVADDPAPLVRGIPRAAAHVARKVVGRG